MLGALPIFQDSNTYVMGFLDCTSDFGDGSRYTNVPHIVPLMYSDAQVIADLVKGYFNWDRVTVFATEGGYGTMASLFFQQETIHQNMKILSQHFFRSGKEDLSSEIKAAKQAGSNIFILFLGVEDAVRLLRQGYDMGLFGDGKQIIGGEYLSVVDNWNSLGYTDNDKIEQGNLVLDLQSVHLQTLVRTCAQLFRLHVRLVCI